MSQQFPPSEGLDHVHRDGFMIPVQIYSQWTPNPNAYKFIVSETVMNEGKATFSSDKPHEYESIALVKNLLNIPNVIQVHLFENVITVTQDGDSDWADLSDTVEGVITDSMSQHNPEIAIAKPARKKHASPDLEKIEEILDRTVRPALQGDGGDVEVVDLIDGVLTIRYEGACGTCPSSLAGTLNAITSFVHDEFDPNIEVVAI